MTHCDQVGMTATIEFCRPCNANLTAQFIMQVFVIFGTEMQGRVNRFLLWLRDDSAQNTLCWLVTICLPLENVRLASHLSHS